MNVTIQGNIVTRHHVPTMQIAALVVQAAKKGRAVAIVQNGGTYDNPLFDFSYPMDKEDHVAYAALIHRTNSENKLKKKVDKGGPNPDNNGPKPTNPRGSGGKVVEQQNVLAVAA